MDNLLDTAKWFLLMLGCCLLLRQAAVWGLTGLFALSDRTRRWSAQYRRPPIAILDGVIHWRASLRRARLLPLATLQRVLIITTSDGPFTADIFWVLVGPDDTTMVVPFLADPDGSLLRILQMLPAFDMQAVIAASASVEDASFPCWTGIVGDDQAEEPADLGKV